MSHNAIEQALSTSRFATYRQAIESIIQSDCPVLALELYEWNAKLAARFFYPLHIYEVVLRNAISDAISKRYGDDWPINKVFVNSLPKQDRHGLFSAIDNNYQGVGKLLPELKFVWFENVLTARHDGRIWKHHIRTAFPNAPASLTPSDIRVHLKSSCYLIRKFRNRCGHHEPVFNNPDLYRILPLMLDVIEWRCTDTKKWLSQQESVTELLSNPVI